MHHKAHHKATSGLSAGVAEYGIWTLTPPSRSTCGCCDSHIPRTYPRSAFKEIRQTGRGGKDQTWYYCPACYAIKLQIDDCQATSAAIACLERAIHKHPDEPGMKFRMRSLFNMPAY